MLLHARLAFLHFLLQAVALVLDNIGYAPILRLGDGECDASQQAYCKHEQIAGAVIVSQLLPDPRILLQRVGFLEQDSFWLWHHHAYKLAVRRGRDDQRGKALAALSTLDDSIKD